MKYILTLIAILAPCAAYALPAVTPVTPGITAGNSGQTIIQQSTNRAVITWGSFDPSTPTVVFAQPSAGSISLNRIQGAGTNFTGVTTENSNDHIVLVNSNNQPAVHSNSPVGLGGLSPSAGPNTKAPDPIDEVNAKLQAVGLYGN